MRQNILKVIKPFVGCMRTERFNFVYFVFGSNVTMMRSENENVRRKLNPNKLVGNLLN
jgi:hypothetical protein